MRPARRRRRCRARRSRTAASSATSSRFSLAVKPDEWPTSRSSPSGVVEPEDERADRALRLARAPAHDDGVDRAHALDLHHAHAARRGGTGASGSLAITPSASCSHCSRLAGGADHRRQVDRAVDARLERRAALVVGQLQQHLVVARQQVEGDEARRRLLGQPLDPRRGRVDALAEQVELLTAALAEDDDLAVEHVAPGGEAQLGEVARQVLAVARLQARPRRRRRTRSRGSRPTWARRPSPRPQAGSRASVRAGAGAAACSGRAHRPRHASRRRAAGAATTAASTSAPPSACAGPSALAEQRHRQRRP